MEHPTDQSLSSYQFTIPPQAEQVAPARRRVADFCQGAGLSDLDADGFVLAFGEACNNAVSYGRPEDGAESICIQCQLTPEQIRVSITNSGNGFHPDVADLSQLPEDMYDTHGRGFALMAALVDDVKVEAKDGCTTVRLSKSRTP